jgi:transcriptional regulator with XRE-family HTH domain
MSRKPATLRTLWLGKLLYDLREPTGLTPKDAARHIVRDSSTVNRIESGTTAARPPDVMALLNFYGVSDETVRSGIEQLTRDIWEKGWWDSFSKTVPARSLDMAWLEFRARRLRDFSAFVPHGLLQTREYAQALLRTSGPKMSDKEIEQWVEFRMRRQNILTQDSPPEYASVIDEGALRRQIGGPEVMRAQFAHLLKLADLPHITLRVLPYTAGAPADSGGAFTYLLLDRPLSDVVLLTTEATPTHIEAPETGWFDEAHTRLESAALSPDESRTYIKTLMEQLT